MQGNPWAAFAKHVQTQQQQQQQARRVRQTRRTGRRPGNVYANSQRAPMWANKLAPGQYIYRPVTHNEARHVSLRNRVEVPNLALPAQAALLRNTRASGTYKLWMDSTWIHTDPETGRKKPLASHFSWMGRYIGGGAYGNVYLTVGNAPTLNELKTLRHVMQHSVFNAFPRAGETFIVKVASDTEAPTFVADSIREATVHDHLSKSPCVQLPGMKPACVASHIPKLYFAGMVRAADPLAGGEVRRFYIMVMAKAPGNPVKKHFAELATGRTISAEAYLHIERTIAMLWLNGVTHNDFHKDNFFFDRPTGLVSVIDFGFAVVMPDDMRARVRQAVARAVTTGVDSLAEVWSPSSFSSVGANLQSYVNRVQFARASHLKHLNARSVWYNPESRALKKLFNRLSPADRARVPLRRAKIWGLLRQSNKTTATANLPPSEPMDVDYPFNTRAARTKRTRPFAAPALARGRRPRRTPVGGMGVMGGRISKRRPSI